MLFVKDNMDCYIFRTHIDEPTRACYNRHMTETEVIQMPRPQRCRRICAMPDHLRFAPQEDAGREAIALSLDEYEAIRLMDREGLTHGECANVMGVSRTTVTEIYAEARRKLAVVIVEGRPLEICGGSVRLCSHSPEDRCGLCGRITPVDKNSTNHKEENS